MRGTSKTEENQSSMGFMRTIKAMIDRNRIGELLVIKGLISHEIVDGNLGKSQPISSYGQGFQRSLIYTLIRIAAKYSTKKPSAKKKDFVPELTWILFEEPEVFLHPTQISVLSSDLRALAAAAGSQVLLSSHNPLFATHSIREISAICRLQRDDCQTFAYQISAQQLSTVLADNQQDAQAWQAAGMQIDPDDLLTDVEAVKYALWLDDKRCGAFFAENILLVEGPTETALLSYMRDKGLLPSCRDVFIMDTIGKFNIHRFMRLFECFGIKHCVLYDGDNGRHAAVDATIQAATKPCTVKIDAFASDLEGFLGIPSARQSHRKPQHVMLQVEQNAIDLNPLAAKVNALVGGVP